MIESSMALLASIVTKSRDESIKKFEKSLEEITQMYHAKSKQNNSVIANQEREIKQLEKEIEKPRNTIEAIRSLLNGDQKSSNNIEEERV